MSFSTRSTSSSPSKSHSSFGSSSPSKTSSSFGSSSSSHVGSSRSFTPASRTPPTGFSGRSSFEPASATRSPVSLTGTTAAPAPASVAGAPADGHAPGWVTRLLGRRPQTTVPAQTQTPPAPTLPPNETRDPYVLADEAQRTPQLAQAQEQAVRAANGQFVQLTNSNGVTEPLRFEQGNNNAWRISDANNNSMIIRGNGLTADQLVQGVAEAADYWSQNPTTVRNSNGTLQLSPGSPRGRFDDVGGGLIQMGLDDLDEMTFDHEFGHAVGFAAQRNANSSRPGRPSGWDEAMRADGTSTSVYANDNAREDFAESWLAYVEARETSTAAYSTLQQAYPNRFAILDAVYNGTQRH